MKLLPTTCIHIILIINIFDLLSEVIAYELTIIIMFMLNKGQCLKSVGNKEMKPTNVDHRKNHK